MKQYITTFIAWFVLSFAFSGVVDKLIYIYSKSGLLAAAMYFVIVAALVAGVYKATFWAWEVAIETLHEIYLTLKQNRA
jgi:hypothetical protein